MVTHPLTNWAVHGQDSNYKSDTLTTTLSSHLPVSEYFVHCVCTADSSSMIKTWSGSWWSEDSQCHLYRTCRNFVSR